MQRFLAGVLVTVGVTMAFGTLSLIGNGHPVGAVIGAFVLTSLAPIGAGVWLWRAKRRQELAGGEGHERAQSRRLFELAQSRGGHLTAAEVYALTGIEVARAEALLDGLCKQGLGEPRVADDGTLVYRLQPLLDAAAKQRARGVLDSQ